MSIRTNCTGHRLTVLRTVGGLAAAKRFYKGVGGNVEKEDYGKPKHFTVEQEPVQDIRSLSRLLLRLERDHNALVIRGEPIPGMDCSGRVTRTLYDVPERDQQAYFQSVPEGIRWLCIDIDKLQLPERLSANSHPESVVRYVISKLPDYFHDVTCHWQFSASAGMSDDNKVSIHLWYWLDRPVFDSEAKRWAKSVNDDQKLVDAALYSPVQVHYTAAPIFDDDIRDPLPRRSGLLEGGEDYVRFPEVPREPVRQTARRGRGLSQSESFEELLDLVGDHPGGEGFHEPLRDAAWAYVLEHGIETDREALKEQLHETVLAADASDHTKQEVTDRASDEHLYGLIDSAIEKLANRGKTGALMGLPPHFQEGGSL